MTDNELIEAILKTLDELVLRVRGRVPGALAVARYDGAMQPYASFAASASSESLDLCVLLQRRNGGAIECTADLVRGGSGDILGEMSPVTIQGGHDAAGAKRLLDAVATFSASQEEMVVREMQADA